MRDGSSNQGKTSNQVTTMKNDVRDATFDWETTQKITKGDCKQMSADTLENINGLGSLKIFSFEVGPQRKGCFNNCVSFKETDH